MNWQQECVSLICLFVSLVTSSQFYSLVLLIMGQYIELGCSRNLLKLMLMYV